MWFKQFPPHDHTGKKNDLTKITLLQSEKSTTIISQNINKIIQFEVQSNLSWVYVGPIQR